MGWNPINQAFGGGTTEKVTNAVNPANWSFAPGGTTADAMGSFNRYMTDRGDVASYYTGHPREWLAAALTGNLKYIAQKRQREAQARTNANYAAIQARQAAAGSGIYGGAAAGGEIMARNGQLAEGQQSVQAWQAAQQAQAMQTLQFILSTVGAFA